MKERLLWIDAVKAFSIFFVILIHSSTIFIDNSITNNTWMIANVYDSISRMAVPLFFMVSGALLLNQKDESIISFFKKRIFKIIVPLFIWSLIYILLKKYIVHKDIDVFYSIIQALNKPTYYHLWFLYSIAGVYLLEPIIKIFIKYSSTDLIVYFVILWSISASVIPFFNALLHLNMESYLPFMNSYLGYFVLGYLLDKLTISNKIFILSILGFIISSLITIFGTYHMFLSEHKFISIFYDNFSITTLSQAISCFLIIKYFSEKVIKNYKYISNFFTIISISSFGIYLVHPIILRVIRKVEILKTMPVVQIPIYATSTFLVSLLVIYSIRRIPYINKITP